MFGRIFLGALSLLLCACAPSVANETSVEVTEVMAEQRAFAEACEPWDDWDKPTSPFNVHGNTFYVGTCGISAILIVGTDNHVLIDSGTEAGAEVVLANIGELALDPGSIDLLLHSHEHFDHVGGHAIIAKATDAEVVASTQSAAVLASGLSHPEDPQYGMHDPMTSVKVGRILRNGDTVQSGSVQVKAIRTPGHSPGAFSWQWESCEDADCKSIVYADSLSPISRDDYKFSDNPEYVAEYREGLQRLREVQCDILLTPHPSASQMLKRAASGTLEGGMSCVEYADRVEERLDKRLAEEAANE